MMTHQATRPADSPVLAGMMLGAMVLGDKGLYDAHDGTLACGHDAGFFSICSVALRNIAEVLQRTGSLPRRMDFSRTFRAFRNAGQSRDALDMYPVFFLPGPADSAAELRRLPRVKHHGLYQRIDYRAFAPVLRRYFQPSAQARTIQARWIDRYRIEPGKTIAVIYRGTDKHTEVAIARPEAYVEQTRVILGRHPDFRILIQTDERSVRDLFLATFGSRCFFIDDMPVSDGGVAVHDLDDAVLGLDRGEWGVMLVALTELLSRMAHVVNHTGNMALWVCLWRGHCRDVVQFAQSGRKVDFGSPGFYLQHGSYLARRAWRRLSTRRGSAR
jgi:hypothetical protein